MSEVIETEGMIIVNLEEGENTQVLIDTVKKYPNRQIAVSIGTRLTAELLAVAMADCGARSLQDVADITLMMESRSVQPLINNDYWVRGESRNPALKTNGLPYRRGKGKNRY
jgi:hypothetical protein